MFLRGHLTLITKKKFLHAQQITNWIYHWTGLIRKGIYCLLGSIAENSCEGDGTQSSKPENSSIFQLHYKIRWGKSYCTVAVNNEGTLTLLNQLPMQLYKGQRVTRLLKMCREKRNYSIEMFWEQIVYASEQKNRPFKPFSIQNILPWPFYTKDIKFANDFSSHQSYKILKTRALL